MTDTYKILAQTTELSRGNDIVLYESPSGYQTAVSHLSIVNTGDSDNEYTLSVTASVDATEVGPLSHWAGTQEASFVPPSNTNLFNAVMSRDGRTVVYAYDNPASGTNGSVVVYQETTNAGWNQLGSIIEGQTLSGGASGASTIGDSNAISADGTIIATCGYGWRTTPSAPTTQTGMAAVYVWDGTNWVLRGNRFVGYYTSSTDYEIIGQWVAMSADGNVVAFLTTKKTTSITDTQILRVYEWNGSSWVKRGSDISFQGQAQSRKGRMVLNKSGNIVLFCGSAYKWQNNQWTELGSGIGLDLYERNSGIAPIEDITSFWFDIDDDETNPTVAMSKDSTATPTASNVGHWGLYKWDGSAWVKQYSQSGPGANQYFYATVSITGDGTQIFLSSPLNDYSNGNFQGRTELYKYELGEWRQVKVWLGQNDEPFPLKGLYDVSYPGSIAKGGTRILFGGQGSDGVSPQFAIYENTLVVKLASLSTSTPDGSEVIPATVYEDIPPMYGEPRYLTDTALSDANQRTDIADNTFGRFVRMSDDGKVLVTTRTRTRATPEAYSGKKQQASDYEVVVYDRTGPGEEWVLRPNSAFSIEDWFPNDENFSNSGVNNDSNSMPSYPLHLAISRDGGTICWMYNQSTPIVFVVKWVASTQSWKKFTIENNRTGYNGVVWGATWYSFLHAIGMSGDGNRIAVGYTRNVSGFPGGVYVFNYNSTLERFQTLGSEISPSGNQDFGGTGAGSGQPIAMNQTGSRLVVGDPLDSSNSFSAGAVYVYDWSGSAWSLNSSFFGVLYGGGLGNYVDVSSDGSTIYASQKPGSGSTTAIPHFYIIRPSASNPVEKVYAPDASISGSNYPYSPSNPYSNWNTYLTSELFGSSYGKITGNKLVLHWPNHVSTMQGGTNEYGSDVSADAVAILEIGSTSCSFSKVITPEGIRSRYRTNGIGTIGFGQDSCAISLDSGANDTIVVVGSPLEMHDGSTTGAIYTYLYKSAYIGYALEKKNRIVVSKHIKSGEHHEFTGGITLSAGDRIYIDSTSDIVVNLSGAQIPNSGSFSYKIFGQHYFGSSTTAVPSGAYYYYGGGFSEEYDENLEPYCIYEVPSSTQAVVSSVFVTNHSDKEFITYDLAVVPSGQTLASTHHVKWDYLVHNKSFDMFNAKLTLSAGDCIYVLPSSVDKVGFTIFGVEQSI